jgi:NAD(P) transhydrogenase subunit alpha
MSETNKNLDVIMVIGFAKETFMGEKRVALVPSSVSNLQKVGFEIVIESGAGVLAGFADSSYESKGVKILGGRAEVFSKADAIVMVRGLGANPDAGKKDIDLMHDGQIIIGLLGPWNARSEIDELCKNGVTAFALELLPRITRAQSMDVLSSMATVAGYKAVVLAADLLPKMFPMMMTAAGTVAPAHVLVIGAGVAGLQAIATARRLGAVVQGYDIRPAVKEQVESLGAKFVELPLSTGETETAGGYARAMDEEFYRRQRELLGNVVAASDIVITTASVPGKKAPVLIPAGVVRNMKSGSVIIDLAAEQGGNCELTKPGETVMDSEVKIVGAVNLASEIPYDASEMYARNIVNFIAHLAQDGKIRIDLNDEITRTTMITGGAESPVGVARADKTQ